MIHVSPQVRIVVAIEPADFRLGIDGLARRCRQVLSADPFCGWLFVFRNKRRTGIKILAYDGQGFNLLYKRISNDKFKFWPGGDPVSVVLEAHQLHVLLRAGDPTAVQAAPPWRSVAMPLPPRTTDVSSSL